MGAGSRGRDPCRRRRPGRQTATGSVGQGRDRSRFRLRVRGPKREAHTVRFHSKWSEHPTTEPEQEPRTEAAAGTGSHPNGAGHPRIRGGASTIAFPAARSAPTPTTNPAPDPETRSSPRSQRLSRPGHRFATPDAVPVPVTRSCSGSGYQGCASAHAFRSKDHDPTGSGLGSSCGSCSGSGTPLRLLHRCPAPASAPAPAPVSGAGLGRVNPPGRLRKALDFSAGPGLSASGKPGRPCVHRRLRPTPWLGHPR